MDDKNFDSLLDVSGKVVLITAAASGMGLAASRLFAERGARVIGVDIRKAALDEGLKPIKQSGGSVETHEVDLTDMTQVNAFADTILANHKVLDVFYNHAGWRGQEKMDYDEEGLVKIFTINLLVPMVLTKKFLPLFKASKAASLIYTASTAGLSSSAGLVGYGATKAGLINFTRSMAAALGPDGIRANVICPGATDTRGMRALVGPDGQEISVKLTQEGVDAMAAHIPLGRMGDPEDVAAAALFLASDAARYVSGLVIPVDGAMTV
jgi:NAD(P)-dependent dehydrogenase (short-subunit alcohol dehydrogenase family)